MTDTKRLRIFAGPNGSGKSTIINIIRNKKIDLGIYLNADEIKVQLDNVGLVDFDIYEIVATDDEFKTELIRTTFFNDAIRLSIAENAWISENKLYCNDKSINDSLSTFLADFIRKQLLGNCNKFTIETVMSHPSKLEYIQKANELGYKTYLYFVSLEAPEINVDRVNARVKMNGHPVPEEKIIKRYYRTMDLLLDAIKLVDKAYFFDNSTSNSVLFGIYKDFEINITEPEFMPQWFRNYVLNKLVDKTI